MVEINLLKIAGVLSTLVIVIIIYVLLNTFLKKKLTKNMKTKKMKHNVIVFVSLISYLFLFISIVLLVVSVTGNLLGVGLTAGLLTAALGWALQRPITGIAGWIMMIFAKPFQKISLEIPLQNNWS